MYKDVSRLYFFVNIKGLSAKFPLSYIPFFSLPFSFFFTSSPLSLSHGLVVNEINENKLFLKTRTSQTTLYIFT